MNKNKGFTLAELMGVLVIIAILALLAIPVIDKTIKENKEQAYQMQLENMKTGLKNWAIANPKLLPEKNGEVVTLTLAQLKQGAFVDTSIKNPKTGKLFPNDMLLTITNYNGAYSYEVVENSGTETNTAYNSKAPTILLNGSAFESVDLNSPYVEKGIVARTSSGAPITNITTVVEEVSIEEAKKAAIENKINTKKPGKYIITYSVNDQEIETTLKRTVTIKDMSAPILNIPKNISILATDVPELRLLDGVTVSDNSGEAITPTVSGIVSIIPGKYTIVYTAVDSSGNTTSKIRVVTVQDTNAYQQLTNTTVVSGSGLYKIGDNDYRYRGEDKGVHNYITIEGQVYRIISIDSQGIKVIAANSILNHAFDELGTITRNNTNNTYCQVATGYNGCNLYAAIKGNVSNGTKTGTVTQNSSIYQLLNEVGTEDFLKISRKIALPNITWNMGFIAPGPNKDLTAIKKEESSYQGEFLLGLINVSDYIEASLDASCQTNGVNYTTNCKNNNWLFKENTILLTMNGYNGNTSGIWATHPTNGSLTVNQAGEMGGIFPVFYLPSSMTIQGGVGTISDPYRMELPEE